MTWPWRLATGWAPGNLALPALKHALAFKRLDGDERMARVTFTDNLQQHVDCPPADAPGATVREVLEQVFAGNPRLRGYVLDDQGALRKHMNIYVDDDLLRDRAGLSDPVRPGAKIYVMQALSGG